MSFKHPSYADKARGLHIDPAKQAVQGVVIWALGWPPLDHETNPKITPTQFHRVRTLKSGIETGAVSKRTDNMPSLKSLKKGK